MEKESLDEALAAVGLQQASLEERMTKERAKRRVERIATLEEEHRKIMQVQKIFLEMAHDERRRAATYIADWAMNTYGS